ncbi:MAG: DUF5123 domain-containing protein [Prevotella sp.]|nr:DUF5123 domain-containing protein [Prevotella sp.]
MKKILSLVALMMMIVMGANAANKTISLVPGPWDKDGATFAAYAWVGEESNWFQFAEVSGVYATQIPDTYTGIILTRINPEGTDPNPWNNVWNQTSDINFTTVADKTVFTITGWNQSDFTVTSPVDALKAQLAQAVEMADLFGIDTTAAKALLENPDATEAQLTAAMQKVMETGVPKAKETVTLAKKFFATFDPAAGTALASYFADAEAALDGTDFEAMYTAAMTLFGQGLVEGQDALTKVITYLQKMEDETVNSDLAALTAAIASKDIKNILPALRQLKDDLPDAAKTYASTTVPSLIAEGQAAGKDVSGMQTALANALVAYSQYNSGNANVVDLGYALYQLIKAVEDYKAAASVVTIESLAIVGDFIGGEATEEDPEPWWNPANGWAMTQDTENPAIWTLVKEFTAEAKKYEYKATANGNWTDYVLPADENANFIFGTEGYPAGDYILTFTANTEENTLTLDVKSNMPENITISPAEGDIAAALDEAKAKVAKVGNITINLTEGVTYTISATLEAPHSITINGNDAIIDASALEEPMVSMADVEAPTEWTEATVRIAGIKVTGLKKAMFFSTCKNYLFTDFTVDGVNVELAANTPVFDFTKGSVTVNFNVTNSTFYAPVATESSFYTSQQGQKATEAGDYTQTFKFQENTMYNLAKGKNFFSHRQNGQKWLAFDVQNNIFVNCGKSGQVIKGMNGGQASANPTWTIIGNAFNFDGADTSADESTGDSEETVQESVAGVVAFADADNGDFNGEFTLAEGAEAPKTLGDPRWTITFPETPVEALYYLVGTMTNWVEDGVKEELKLEKNEEAGEGIEEYMITLDFEANAEFKVVKPEGEGYVWYPDGENNNYVIEKAGNYTVYFRPNGDGGSDWHYGVIYVVDNETDGINAVSAANQNAVIFNLAGQKVMKAQKGLYIVNGKKILMK